MEKFCVFCGQKPTQKNNEHVIPQWLLELSGRPDRPAFFGFDHKGSEFSSRIFSFDSFKFPACKDCNENFGRIEDAVKNVIVRLKSQNVILGKDVSLLLDWLDKIRIGLWLALYYLSKNQMNIKPPRFHISTRMAMKDRMVAIYESDASGFKINFEGVDSPVFSLSPSCFTLRLGYIALFNASCDFLVSRRCGFPYPMTVERLNDDGLYNYTLAPGLERAIFPIIRLPLIHTSWQFYQPIFAANLMTKNEMCQSLYSTPYVLRHSLDFDKGIGNVFTQNNGRIGLISQEVEYRIGELQYETAWLSKRLKDQTLSIQAQLLEQLPVSALVRKVAAQNRRWMKLPYLGAQGK